MAGEHRQIHLDKPGSNSKWWSHNGSIPVNRPFTWYKTTFAAPAGEDALVVDLLGLNKGAAWVNGNSLGRYWPSYTAAEMGGCHVCDYRGKFKAEGDGIRCLTGCGEPSQRFYHVPRSFLRAGEPNTLVLFEEAGGDPARAAFHTVGVGPVCVAAAEVGDDVTLSCGGGGGPRRRQRRRGQLRRHPGTLWRLPGRLRVQGRAQGVHGRVRRQGVVHGQVHARVRRRRVRVRQAHRAGHLLIPYYDTYSDPSDQGTQRKFRLGDA